MIQLRDSNPSTSYHIVTNAIIFANVLGFVWELSWGRNLPQAVVQYAIIPARYAPHPTEAVEHFGPFASLPSALLPFVSSMFLHGGWLHLIGNMWMLKIFGGKVEDRLGEGKFLLFYLAGGIAAWLVHLITNASSLLPTLGASGAVAAVMGAHFRLFPAPLIRAPIPPLFFGPTVVAPAWVFLSSWFLLQFFYGVASLAAPGVAVGGIAWWAHIGGFLFGLILCQYFAAPTLGGRTRDR